ncbi:MAG: DUF3300 domain-containing protein [Alphaproteobacteria bacterium]|nr:DUF3300 domain-containing protein [Alphaproteobacteria bacterium]
MTHLVRKTAVAALPLLMVLAGAQAQAPQGPTRAEAEAALNPAPSRFSKAQLDQMLAPIALYPDQLLTQMLMAATFPDQVIAAGKWLEDADNAALKGDDLAKALQPLPWDPSVKSLIPFPQIIAMMNAHFDWTEALGVAFTNQEVETMSRVQFLRERAMKAGQLKSTKQLAVREEASDIIIEPADAAMVYVPVYNPAVVYGHWPDADAPPVYLPPPPNFYRGEIGPEIGYSVGFGVVGGLWGWGRPDWRHHEVAVDPERYRSITTTTYNVENHIEIRNETWHRTAPVAVVPAAARPQPAAAAAPAAQVPQGTVSPAAVRTPPAAAVTRQAQPAQAPAATPPSTQTPTAQTPTAQTPPPGTARPPENAPAAAPTTRGSETAHPGEGHAPAAAAHPEASHPGEPPHPPAAPPAAPPHPEASHPPPAPEAHPAAPGHPAGPPPALSPAHPTEAPHAPEPQHAAPPPPPAAPHPAPPPPAAPPHPAAPPAPAPAPHPAPPPAPHPAPPPAPHPAPAPPPAPHPAPPPAAHPPGPPPGAPHPPQQPAKPPPKPGEEEKHDQH